MRTSKRIRVSAGVIAIWIAFLPIQANADWVQDFYSSAGAASNVTNPQAIATQGTIGYSGGSVAWRVPNKNLQPFQITLPSMKAGCGGIDLHMGGWSFVNKTQFVQALRNFGQASVGYFFQLALKSISPEISAALDTIQYYANQINQFSMNSCAASQTAAKGVWDIAEKGIFSDGENANRANGSAPDNTAAKLDFIDSGTPLLGAFKAKYQEMYGKAYTSANGNLTRPDANSKPNPGPYNLVWEILNRSNATSSMTQTEMEMVMAFTGTAILKIAGASGGGDVQATPDPRNSLFNFKELVGFDSVAGGSSSPVTYTSLNSYSCGSDVLCESPTVVTNSAKPFKVAVLEAIKIIRNSIVTRTSGVAAINADATATMVLRMSSVPIYRAVALSQTSGMAGLVATGMVEELADFAAIDASVNFVHYYLGILENATLAGIKLDDNAKKDLIELKKTIRAIREDMHQQLMAFYKVKGDPYARIERLDKVERAMYANMNVTLASNARFGRKQ
jgi:conjugative transfer pilus assembly protein TraH